MYEVEVHNQIQSMCVEVRIDTRKCASWVQCLAASYGSLILKSSSGIIGFMCYKIMGAGVVICGLGLDRLLILQSFKGNWLVNANLCLKCVGWWISCGLNIELLMSSKRLRSKKGIFTTNKLVIQINAKLSDVKKDAKALSYVGCGSSEGSTLKVKDYGQMVCQAILGSIGIRLQVSYVRFRNTRIMQVSCVILCDHAGICWMMQVFT